MKKLISYIFPIYNEYGNIDHLYKTMKELLNQNNKYDYEMIFVNDGSQDNSLEKLLQLQKVDERVTVINFARNFGHQVAVTAGLDHVNGDAVIIMDSDMQDPPHVSFDLVKKWEEGYDVVYAQRRSRRDSILKRITANVFYRLLDKLADVDIPRNTGDFRLLDRRVVKQLNKFREHNRFLRGLVSYVGFKQTGVLFDRDKRLSGKTGYPLKRMVKFAIDGLLGFSWTPIRLITKLGYFISLLSFIGIIYAIAMKFLRPDVTVPGWTFIVISILFIGGIQLVTLGVLGNYIGRIYTESQNRPLYIIENVYRSNKSRKG
ncbi:glycosyltransferase [Candidatus Saccharibacteria bacterium RIFCSPHIGHO2_12_FULL_47_16b]|nr:MAG: glycosyltransferase [Candidatus Saccharibacteria bacterium RIFCSPHIGHO2_12_FULL_47_16b]